jgi:hypothetical protein
VGAGFGAGAGATWVGAGGLDGAGEELCEGVVTGAAGVVAGVTGAA